ncbi:MAG: methyl-accepting chemotaxis protein [Pseudomonadota bacterium]
MPDRLSLYRWCWTLTGTGLILLALWNAWRHGQWAAGAGAGLLIVNLWAAWQLAASRQEGHRTRVRQLDLLREGRLAEIEPKGDERDEAVAEVASAVSALVAQVRSASVIIDNSGQELTHHSESLRHRVEKQAASLEETSATVEQLAASSQLTALNVADIAAFVTKAALDCQACQQAVQQLGNKVNLILAGIRGMRESLDVINSIALQTNILALNAAIEASRAGTLGRGFAVVAGEVRSLAIRCRASAEQITESVTDAVAHARQGEELLVGATQRMGVTLSQMEHISERVVDISSTAEQQSAGVNHLSEAIQRLEADTQSNAQLVVDISRQAALLCDRAQTIAAQTARYRLQQGTADEAMVLVRRAIAHCRQMGLAAGLVDLSAADNPFRDRDLYVWAHNADHVVVGISLQGTDRLGRDERELRDAKGFPMVSEFIRIGLSEGHGWVDYTYLNPETGHLAPKVSYVESFEHVVFGCGVYKPPEM